MGGEDLADPVRGAYNEGGLYGEREGWHLPGFDDGDWESATIPDTKNRTGVSWFRTTFKANVPKGYDAPLGLTFEDDSKQRYRALVFVNGWQLGRYGMEFILRFLMQHDLYATFLNHFSQRPGSPEDVLPS